MDGSLVVVAAAWGDRFGEMDNGWSIAVACQGVEQSWYEAFVKGLARRIRPFRCSVEVIEISLS